MHHVDQVQAGHDQLQISLSVLDGAELRPRFTTKNQTLAATVRPLRPYQMDVSGSQVLLGLSASFTFMGLGDYSRAVGKTTECYIQNNPE